MNLSKSLVLVSSLLAAGAAFSQNHPEGSYPPVAASAPADRAVVAQEAARYILAGRPGLVAGEGRPVFTPTFDEVPETRSGIQADLRQWNRAGLSELTRGEATPDFGAPVYRAALNRYERATDAAAAPGDQRASVQSFAVPTVGN